MSESNAVSQWLGANLQSALYVTVRNQAQTQVSENYRQIEVAHSKISVQRTPLLKSFDQCFIKT